MRVRVGLQTKEREIQREECECVKAVVKRGRSLALKRARPCWRREKEGEFHWKGSINTLMLLFKEILKIHVYSCNDVVINKTGSYILHIFNIFENRVIISYCCNSNKTIKNCFN